MTSKTVGVYEVTANIKVRRYEGTMDLTEGRYVVAETIEDALVKYRKNLLLEEDTELLTILSVKEFINALVFIP